MIGKQSELKVDTYVRELHITIESSRKWTELKIMSFSYLFVLYLRADLSVLGAHSHLI
jgi:hypothetical protein